MASQASQSGRARKRRGPRCKPSAVGLRRFFLRGPTPGGERPNPKYGGQHRRQAIPGHRVLQVIVGQRDNELSRLRQAAGRDRRFLFDIKRRYRIRSRVKSFRGSDRSGIAREPKIMRGIVRRREPVPLVEPAQRTGDFNWL